MRAITPSSRTQAIKIFNLRPWVMPASLTPHCIGRSLSVGLDMD